MLLSSQSAVEFVADVVMGFDVALGTAEAVAPHEFVVDHQREAAEEAALGVGRERFLVQQEQGRDIGDTAGIPGARDVIFAQRHIAACYDAPDHVPVVQHERGFGTGLATFGDMTGAVRRGEIELAIFEPRQGFQEVLFDQRVRVLAHRDPTFELSDEETPSRA